MAIPYVKQTHTDGVVNQFNAARANQIEQGIFDAHYQPAVRVTHNAVQSITNNVVTVLAFNTERFDQAGNAADTMHDTVTNNSRLTCRYAGVYQITASVSWAASVATESRIAIRLNGTTEIARQRVFVGDARDESLTTLWAMAVNDYVEFTVFQNTAGAVNAQVSNAFGPEFMMVRVG